MDGRRCVAVSHSLDIDRRKKRIFWIFNIQYSKVYVKRKILNDKRDISQPMQSLSFLQARSHVTKRDTTGVMSQDSPRSATREGELSVRG